MIFEPILDCSTAVGCSMILYGIPDPNSGNCFCKNISRVTVKPKKWEQTSIWLINIFYGKTWKIFFFWGWVRFIILQTKHLQTKTNKWINQRLQNQKKTKPKKPKKTDSSKTPKTKKTKKNKEHGLIRGPQTKTKTKKTKENRLITKCFVLGASDESIFFVFFGFVFFCFGFGVEADNLQMKCIVRGCFPDEMHCEVLFQQTMGESLAGGSRGGVTIYIIYIIYAWWCFLI